MSSELLEAVDSLLETAPCDCSHKRRYERGEHLSGCYLFDLNIARAKVEGVGSPAASGYDEEMGWIMEGATKGELAAYDAGCAGMMDALRRILDGKDDGAGVANEPWESLRRRLIALVAGSAAASQPTGEPLAAEWLLFEHNDGRYAAAPTAEAATFTHGVPAWHRVGPLTIHAQSGRAAPTGDARGKLLPSCARVVRHRLIEQVRIEYDDDNRSEVYRAMNDAGWTSGRSIGPANLDGSRSFADYERAIDRQLLSTPTDARAAGTGEPTLPKDHQVAALVNELTHIGYTYGTTQQLRERIAHVIRPLFASPTLEAPKAAGDEQGEEKCQ